MQLTDKQLDNFWAKVDVHLEDECWWWTAGRTRDGYGRFRTSSGLVLSHRIMYELMVDAIPEGMVLDHICHNPSCVNPRHLRACTHNQNICNSKTRSDSKSGLRGISKHGSKWMARIWSGGVRLYLGTFDSQDIAYTAYCEAAIKYHGAFANSGQAAHTNREVHIEGD